MPAVYDPSAVRYAHQCERCGKVIKTLTPDPPPADRCEYRKGSRMAAMAFLMDWRHKFWPARCEGQVAGKMLLEPLRAAPEGTAAAGQYIRCAVTGQTLAWNEAAKSGWVLDRNGKAFEAYYSPLGLGTMAVPNG